MTFQVKALNGDLFSVELSPERQTVRHLIDSIKPLLDLQHPYDAVDIFHPLSTVSKMSDRTTVKEGIEYLVYVRSFDRVIQHAVQTYSKTSLSAMSHCRTTRYYNPFEIIRDWYETFQLLEREFAHSIPIDPPGYVRHLKEVDGTHDFDFEDEFMAHLKHFGERVWKINPYLRGDEEVDLGGPLLDMYIAQRRWKEIRLLY